MSYRAREGAFHSPVAHLKVAIKKPGENSFTAKTVATFRTRPFSSAIGQTIDLRNSKRYFHLFVDASFYSGKLKYYRSEDEGESWRWFGKEDEKVFANVLNNAVANSQVDEGGVYIQFNDGERGRIKRSRDHGNTFDREMRLDGKVGENSKLLLCGAKNKGILLSAHYDSYKRPCISYARLGEKEMRMQPPPLTRLGPSA
eukprot:TRINITY_DN10510_c0_g2_i1.p1 TRINITY_DN10510_c0_g2~~TRINITY_DN10510_c0_g2_i1.p1  ORF type:complete len:200 (-),score=35.74 TRINITY_DN10510_c0_g2_i1:271-870(-)